jgi:hypothetical protein
MPLGEIIAETVGRVLGEFLIHVVAYWTGYMFITTISLGQIQLAPALSFGEKNKGKKKWHQVDWSIWIRREGRKKELKAEVVILVGIILWVVGGVLLYLALTNKGANQSQ